jgi:hypothetical protein
MAVDPAVLTISPIPANVFHLKMKVTAAMSELRKHAPYDLIVRLLMPSLCR